MSERRTFTEPRPFDSNEYAAHIEEPKGEYNYNPATFGQALDAFKKAAAEPAESDEEAWQLKSPLERQIEAEQSYARHGNVLVEPAVAGEQLSPQEIIERMETDHSVKEAPRLAEQLNDATRTNLITYISRQSNTLTINTSNSGHSKNRVVMTEHDMLAGMDTFLHEAADFAAGLGYLDEVYMKARSMRENLTFIGKKEYEEAAAGIATYWKALLERNPNQQILAVSGEIMSSMIKSDQYLLEHILANFSDEEAEKYKGRLIVDSADIAVTKHQDIKIVVLDDWTISGQSLRTVVSRIGREHPSLKPSIELQLVAANEERIKHGFKTGVSGRGQSRLTIPLRSYYRAHHSDKSTHDTHTTGFHSSVDYDFEVELSNIAMEVRMTDKTNSYADLHVMPPLTNIVRPYRMPGYELTQRDRFVVTRHESAAAASRAYESANL